LLDVAHEINDIAFVGVHHPELGPGFDLWVGGGTGRTSPDPGGPGRVRTDREPLPAGASGPLRRGNVRPSLINAR
ncbi:hypothetical protein, partial [Streptomyces sp. NPDC049906]|uniref:hypothetical protein n=1 Tax=Streptomyces sp. NPDC049906 TaxID=3155656 RepID=UPI003429F8B4